MKRTTPLKRTPLAPGKPLARSAPAKRRRAISPASPAQREKLREVGYCIVTGATEGVDPAHLWPRSLGGCDDPLCVVPLRRDVHRALDEREGFDLLPHLLAHGLVPELCHALAHANGDLVGLLERVTGDKWRPVAP